MINSADESELSRLFFLTDFQVKALADYIHSSGRIYSIYEVALIPGFNPDLARMISPFLSLEFRSEIRFCFIKARKAINTIQLFTKVSGFRYISTGSTMEITDQV